MPNISTLRSHLFATLEGLRNGSVEVDKARAINETAQVLINSAKAEVDFMKATGNKTASGFIPVDEPPSNLPHGHTAHGIKQVEHVPGATITTHHMR